MITINEVRTIVKRKPYKRRKRYAVLAMHKLLAVLPDKKTVRVCRACAEKEFHKVDCRFNKRISLPLNELQKLAVQTNWRKMAIKGIEAQLENLCYQLEMEVPSELYALLVNMQITNRDLYTIRKESILAGRKQLQETTSNKGRHK